MSYNEKTQLCLAVELMGKHSNVILYNYDTNVIIGCAHNISSEKSRERELYGLLPYVYPPKQKKKNLLRVTFDSFKENLDMDNLAQSISSKYHYLTMFLVQDMIETINHFSIETLYNKLTEFLSKKEYNSFISNDYSKFYLFEKENCKKLDTINSMIDDYFSHHQEKIIISNLKSKDSIYETSFVNLLNCFLVILYCFSKDFPTLPHPVFIIVTCSR